MDKTSTLNSRKYTSKIYILVNSILFLSKFNYIDKPKKGSFRTLSPDNEVAKEMHLKNWTSKVALILFSFDFVVDILRVTQMYFTLVYENVEVKYFLCVVSVYRPA